MSQLSTISRNKHNLQLIGTLFMTAWVASVINILSGGMLIRLGLLPRHLEGLKGILLGPLIHGSFSHLISNSIPFLVLGGLVSLQTSHHFRRTLTGLYLLSQGLLWILGRSAWHIGLSGLVFSFFGFILTTGYLKRDILSIAIAIITILSYGGLLIGILPLQPHVSWEGHLTGLLAGIGVACLSSATHK